MFQELSSFKLGTAGLVGELSFGTTKDRSGGRRQTIEGKFEFGKAGRYYQWSRGRGLSHVSFPSKCLWLSTTQILELRNILGVRPPTIWKNKLLLNAYLGDFMILCWLLRPYFLVCKYLALMCGVVSNACNGHIRLSFIFFAPNGLKITFRHWSIFHV